MRPELKDLETFVAVCDAKGFGKAAERLGVSQPAVSNRIRKLEADLGTTLFEHPRRRIILTAPGIALLDACTRLFAGLDELARAVPSASWTPADPIRIACAGAFGRYVIFPLLRDPRLAEIGCTLLFRRPKDVYRLVESGECEIGFTYEPRVTRTMELRAACVEAFVLVAPPGHPLAPGVPLREVSAHGFVTYEECDYVFGKWFADVHGAQPTTLGSVSHFERIEEVVGMVADGRGLSIVPEHSVREARSAGAVVVLEQGWAPCHNLEYAVTRPGRVPRPEVLSLLSDLAEVSVAPIAAR